MNDYFNSLQKVLQSTQELLDNQYPLLNSTEIHDTASGLQTSVAEGIVEVRLAANSLKKVLQTSLEKLDYFEQVRLSKQRIVGLPRAAIWEQIEKSRSCLTQVQDACTDCKKDAIQRVKASWESRIVRLKNKYFIDHSQCIKSSIGRAEKEGFLNDLYPEINLQAPELEQAIRYGFKLLWEEAITLYSPLLQELMIVFDPTTKWQKKLHFEALTNEIEAKLNHLSQLSDGTSLGPFQADLRVTLGEWKNRRGEIGWDDVVRLKDQAAEEIEKRITVLLDDRTTLLKHFLEEAIALYTELLELQIRYQQETLEQQLAEKTWLHQQRQELQAIQEGLDIILNTPVM